MGIQMYPIHASTQAHLQKPKTQYTSQANPLIHNTSRTMKNMHNIRSLIIQGTDTIFNGIFQYNQQPMYEFVF